MITAHAQDNQGLAEILLFLRSGRHKHRQAFLFYGGGDEEINPSIEEFGLGVPAQPEIQSPGVPVRNPFN